MPLKSKEPENEAGKQARQQYLEHAQKITGDASLDYNTLYQRFAQNDWAAIKLHGNKVPLAPMSQYVRSTVMKAVQKTERSPGQKSVERSSQRQAELE
jgi:hypothetical protein